MGSEIPQRPYREKAVFQVTQLWFDISHGASRGQLLEQPAIHFLDEIEPAFLGVGAGLRVLEISDRRIRIGLGNDDRRSLMRRREKGRAIRAHVAVGVNRDETREIAILSS